MVGDGRGDHGIVAVALSIGLFLAEAHAHRGALDQIREQDGQRLDSGVRHAHLNSPVPATVAPKRRIGKDERRACLG